MKYKQQSFISQTVVRIKNTQMQYTAFFTAVKLYNFEIFSFLICAQNIDCGYTLGPYQ